MAHLLLRSAHEFDITLRGAPPAGGCFSFLTWNVANVGKFG